MKNQILTALLRELSNINPSILTMFMAQELSPKEDPKVFYLLDWVFSVEGGKLKARQPRTGKSVEVASITEAGDLDVYSGLASKLGIDEAYLASILLGNLATCITTILDVYPTDGEEYVWVEEWYKPHILTLKGKFVMRGHEEISHSVRISVGQNRVSFKTMSGEIASFRLTDRPWEDFPTMTPLSKTLMGISSSV